MLQNFDEDENKSKEDKGMEVIVIDDDDNASNKYNPRKRTINLLSPSQDEELTCTTIKRSCYYPNQSLVEPPRKKSRLTNNHNHIQQVMYIFNCAAIFFFFSNVKLILI